ncbi:hypothetical protein DF143_34845 [Burkholderia cenocepacia]|nr:hypothetical protein DF143_34845 [Burkholderia cenocepacia]RQV33661.1 hypothetical protein DF033_34245 [Burkholderia cenocepacia]
MQCVRMAAIPDSSLRIRRTGIFNWMQGSESRPSLVVCRISLVNWPMPRLPIRVLKMQHSSSDSDRSSQDRRTGHWLSNAPSMLLRVKPLPLETVWLDSIWDGEQTTGRMMRPGSILDAVAGAMNQR